MGFGAPRVRSSNIFPFQEGADVMFNSALIYELAVLKMYAEPLLFAIDKDCPEYLEAKRLLKFLDYFLPMPQRRYQPEFDYPRIYRRFAALMYEDCFDIVAGKHINNKQ